ncbi:unknown [Clostridium sp. CAG:343]|jgi:(p)ppGpp synthase/HD superfamily hydrolase|nr:unknown [Clostridium sp. CAG:343]
MVGCKINSIEMPLVTKLQDGNIVEIITSELEMLQKLEEWSK